MGPPPGGPPPPPLARCRLPVPIPTRSRALFFGPFDIPEPPFSWLGAPTSPPCPPYGQAKLWILFWKRRNGLIDKFFFQCLPEIFPAIETKEKTPLGFRFLQAFENPMKKILGENCPPGPPPSMAKIF